MKNSSNKKINSRFTIEVNDERPHKNEIYMMREWWYYNAIFNHKESDLKNWSISSSISISPRFGSTVIVLYDDKNNNYGSITDFKTTEEIKVKGHGVNVNIDRSFIRGMYPKWNVHFENTSMDNIEIVADLEYKATKQPIWILKNTGHNISTSMLGYYFIMNCDVEGTITMDNTKYKIKGIGYHDHTWSPIYKKKVKTLDKTTTKKLKTIAFNRDFNWDWIYFHFDNRSNIFIGKIYFSKRNLISFLMPGTLNFVTNENKLTESYFFPIIYKNFQKTSIPNLKIPNEINIKSMKINPLNKYPIKGPFLLELNYKTENIKELVYGDSPQWGIWTSSGKVTGKLRGFRKEIELKGFGIVEYTDNV